MDLNDIQNAIYEAQRVQRRADDNTDRMARLIKSRLKHVTPWVLADLKKELKNFNAHTSEWKD